MSDLKLPRVNRVLLAGRVVRDFTLRYTSASVPVAMFTVAFNRPVKGEDGNWTEVASFVNVLVSHRLAEQCADRLKKGSPLYLEGRLQTRKFDIPGGKSRTLLEIKAEQVQFLDSRPTTDAESPRADVPKVVEGDLPF